MHSYLICTAKEHQQVKIDALVKKIGAEIHEFKIEKIEEVREMNNFTKLKFAKPTAIIIKNIENATTEALNAFLKNLEEPQDNLKYILTTTSVYKVLPTIVSRCQIVRTKNNKQKTINKEIQKFLEMSTADKLRYVDAIKGREEATAFVEEITLQAYFLLHQREANYPFLGKLLEKGNSTLFALKANGNVILQLTNLAVSL